MFLSCAVVFVHTFATKTAVVTRPVDSDDDDGNDYDDEDDDAELDGVAGDGDDGSYRARRHINDIRGTTTVVTVAMAMPTTVPR